MIPRQFRQQQKQSIQKPSNSLLYSLKRNDCDPNFASSPPNTFLENLEKRITSYQINNSMVTSVRIISEKI